MNAYMQARQQKSCIATLYYLRYKVDGVKQCARFVDPVRLTEHAVSEIQNADKREMKISMRLRHIASLPHELVAQIEDRPNAG